MRFAFIILFPLLCLAEPEWLSHLNKIRHRHQSQPLILSESLSYAAKQVADWNFAIGKLTHSKLRYGENIGMVAGGDVIKMIDLCYAEISQYDFDNPGFTAGHFTQLVWNSSKYIGLGVTGMYIVMEFDPPGNSPNYKSNVFPESSDPIVASPHDFTISNYSVIVGVPLSNASSFDCIRSLNWLNITKCEVMNYSTTKKYYMAGISQTKSGNEIKDLLKNTSIRNVIPKGSTLTLMSENKTILKILI
jgi:hypothetical protein